MARNWRLAGVGAAVLVLAVAGLAAWVQRAEPVSAAEIVRKAQVAASGAAASGVHSFEMVEEIVTRTNSASRPDQPARAISTQSRSVRHTWFRAPDHWRYELQFTELPGQGPDPGPRVTVADGQTIWSYDPRTNALQVSPGRPGGPGKKGDYGLYGSGSLDAVLQRASDCYQPRLSRREQVTGRPAFVVKMGPTSCPSAAAADGNGPLTLWLDEQTFFVLKTDLRDTADTREIRTTQVTSIRYNPELADALFTFAAPPGASVLDNRPKPPPAGGDDPPRGAP